MRNPRGILSTPRQLIIKFLWCVAFIILELSLSLCLNAASREIRSSEGLPSLVSILVSLSMMCDVVLLFIMSDGVSLVSLSMMCDVVLLSIMSGWPSPHLPHMWALK